MLSHAHVPHMQRNTYTPHTQPSPPSVWLALEHKGIPYDTVLIDLRDKPQWYKDMVPTTLVPAVEINGQVVYESRDILMVRGVVCLCEGVGCVGGEGWVCEVCRVSV